MATIDTLGALIDHGFRLSIHCENQFCRHSAALDLKVLVERFGREFQTVGKPNPLAARMVCSKCGSKELGLILLPSTGYDTGPVSPGAHAGFVPGVARPNLKKRSARRKVRL